MTNRIPTTIAFSMRKGLCRHLMEESMDYARTEFLAKDNFELVNVIHLMIVSRFDRLFVPDFEGIGLLAVMLKRLLAPRWYSKLATRGDPGVAFQRPIEDAVDLAIQTRLEPAILATDKALF